MKMYFYSLFSIVQNLKSFQKLKIVIFFQTIFTQYQVKSNNALILDTLRLSMCVAD